MTSFVITGSSKGIGRALAKYCVGRGDQVLISGRNAQDVEQVVADLDGADLLVGLAADVSELDQVQALWDKALAEFGQVDVWINNAGVAHTTKPIAETSAADVQRMVTTNMLGTIHGCQVAARGMQKQGSGKIFNILGGGSDGEYFPGMGVYGSTKRGLDYLTTALCKELKDSPVLVGKVRPGLLITEGMLREIKADPSNFERSRKFMNILGDLPETVAPYLIEEMLRVKKSGSKIAWLNGAKIAGRFLMAKIKPRGDLFATLGV